jgi:hypothetical protein
MKKIEAVTGVWNRTQRSNKVPWILAGSAIGGFAAYLVTTGSGRRMMRSIREMDMREFEHRIEDSRDFIEKKSRAVTDTVRKALVRAKTAIESGRHAYEEAIHEPHGRISTLQRKNTEITSAAHNTVEGVSRTAKTVGDSLLGPFEEFVAMARAVSRGARALASRQR